MGLFEKLARQMAKTSAGLKDRIKELSNSFKKVDEDFFEELEEILIMADLGFDTTEELMEGLRALVKKEGITDTEVLTERLRGMIVDSLSEKQAGEDAFPLIILVVGVNGVGKTTTIGKLAHYYKSQGKSVLLAAADTFRAAAIDQLAIWAERNDVGMIRHQDGADPGAVIFDAIQAAKARGTDVLLCDTAGRLHNKVNLMNELKKLHKIASGFEGAKRETYIVLDATTGQNALSQTALFTEAADVTGVIMTKLDGTAKGGILIPLVRQFDLPVRFIGVGEGIEDLEPFDAKAFVEAII